MEGESNSSSGESKALSAVAVDHVYKCPNCSRVFTSMRARGGHQIAHRKKRPIRKRHTFSPNISPVLAAVLAHHISSDDEQQAAASKAEETSTQSAPEMVVQPGTIEQQNQSATQQQKTDAVQLNRRAKAKKERSERHPRKKSARREKPQKQKLCTQDFLSGWNPKSNVADGAGTSKRSVEDATLDLFTRVSKEEEELDLELQLRSKNADKLDLKLKLGF